MSGIPRREFQPSRELRPDIEARLIRELPLHMRFPDDDYTPGDVLHMEDPLDVMLVSHVADARARIAALGELVRGPLGRVSRESLISYIAARVPLAEAEREIEEFDRQHRKDLLAMDLAKVKGMEVR